MSDDSPITAGSDESTRADGSSIHSVHSNRKVKVYPIFETELNMIGMFNIISTLFFSASAACFSGCFALYLEKQVTEQATPAGELLLSAGPKITFLLGVVFFAVAAFSVWRRGSILDQIKSQVVERSYTSSQ